MELNTIVVAILALICYFILPLLVLLFVKDYKKVKLITKIILGIYIVILLIGVWTRVEVTRKAVTISLDYTYGFFNKNIRWGFSKLKTFDILVNLVMLTPIGISLAILKNESLIKLINKSIVFGLIIGVTIELGQYLLPVYRSVQLSDVIFNMLSLVFGVIVGELILLISKRGVDK